MFSASGTNISDEKGAAYRPALIAVLTDRGRCLSCCWLPSNGAKS